MGCGCNFGKLKWYEEKNEFIDGDIDKLKEKIQNNNKLLKLIIKIQSVYRGYKIRSLIKNLEITQNNYEMNITSPSQLVESKNFRQHNTNEITQNELKELFEKYTPLEDNIKVEINGPTQFENNNAIYYGEWDYSNNMRHGRGIQLWNEGSKYYGYWVKDKASIKGKLMHSDGDIYEGEWLDDKPNGKGVYYHIDGTVYEGEWKDDKQHGFGKETWPDGAWYEGQYFEGKKHGKGKFHWADDSLYEGNFVDNNINGEGVYNFSDKRKYVGTWANNKLEGKGIFTWPDGRKYEGEYKNDKKEGYGIFSWNDGKIYKGYWKNGRQHGEGEFYNPTEDRWRKGIWENGKRKRWIED